MKNKALTQPSPTGRGLRRNKPSPPWGRGLGEGDEALDRLGVGQPALFGAPVGGQAVKAVELEQFQIRE